MKYNKLWCISVQVECLWMTNGFLKNKSLKYFTKVNNWCKSYMTSSCLTLELCYDPRTCPNIRSLLWRKQKLFFFMIRGKMQGNQIDAIQIYRFKLVTKQLSLVFCTTLNVCKTLYCNFIRRRCNGDASRDR